MTILSSKKIILSALLVLATLASLFLVLEFFFRASAYYYDTRVLGTLKDLKSAAHTPGPEEETELIDIVRASENPRIIYELKPGISVKFQGRRVTVNEKGFRGENFQVEKKMGEVRIAGIGDSSMFGWGVGDDECYMSLLKKMLSRKFPNRVFETINTAVPGYNTVMEVETLEHKALLYKPDIVIVHFVENDMDLPNFIRRGENYFSLRKWFFPDFLISRIKGVRNRPGSLLVDTPRQLDGNYESDPERVPEEYRDMVGIEAYRNAMEKLKRLSGEYGFETVVLSHWALTGEVRDICASLGFDIVDAGFEIVGYMKANGIEEYLGSPLTISIKDPHHSALGHKIIAGELLDRLSAFLAHE